MARWALGAIVALAALLATISGTSWAAGTRRVAGIEIVGTTRSTRDTVLTIARVHEGDPWREGLDQEALKNLRNSTLFYDVAVEVREAAPDVALVIRLRDKWTLIPIPFASSRGGKSSYGLTLMESNLFGMGNAVFLSALVTDGVFGGSLFFVDPHVAGSRWSVFASGMQVDSEVTVWDEHEKTGSYRQRSSGAWASVGYRFAKRTTLSLGLRFSDEHLYEPTDGVIPPEDTRRRSLSASLMHEGADRFEERSEGLSGRLSVETGIDAFGDTLGATSISGEARAAFNPLSDQTLEFVFHGLWTDQPAYDTGWTLNFLRGYESGRFRPDRLLGGSVNHQVPLLRFREAKLSVVPFADWAFLRDGYRSFSFKDAQVDAGIALGVYVRRVAFPVFQITVAYGASTGKIVPGFSLGFSF